MVLTERKKKQRISYKKRVVERCLPLTTSCPSRNCGKQLSLNIFNACNHRCLHVVGFGVVLTPTPLHGGPVPPTVFCCFCIATSYSCYVLQSITCLFEIFRVNIDSTTQPRLAWSQQQWTWSSLVGYIYSKLRKWLRFAAHKYHSPVLFWWSSWSACYHGECVVVWRRGSLGQRLSTPTKPTKLLACKYCKTHRRWADRKKWRVPWKAVCCRCTLTMATRSRVRISGKY